MSNGNIAYRVSGSAALKPEHIEEKNALPLLSTSTLFALRQQQIGLQRKASPGINIGLLVLRPKKAFSIL